MRTSQSASRDSWQEIASEAFVPLRIRGQDLHFSAQLDSEVVGDTALTRVRATPGDVLRAEELIDDGDTDVAMLAVQLRGTGIVEQSGRAAELRPAHAALYLADRPYRLRYPSPTDVLVIRSPASTLGLPREALETASAVALAADRTDALRLLTRIAGAALSGRGILPPAEAVRVSLELLRETLSLRAGLPMRARSRETIRAELLTRIESGLADPGLDVGALAASAHISVRTVHSLFAEIGTSPARAVRTVRLGRARQLLETTTMSIVEVALACGFAEATSFARAFRREFDISPAAHRAAARNPDARRPA